MVKLNQITFSLSAFRYFSFLLPVLMCFDKLISALINYFVFHLNLCGLMSTVTASHQTIMNKLTCKTVFAKGDNLYPGAVSCVVENVIDKMFVVFPTLWSLDKSNLRL